MVQFLIRKKRKILQQIEILNDNSAHTTHRGAKLLGSDLFLLLNVV